MWKRSALALAVFAVTGLATAPVAAATITFDEPARGFVHGSIVSTQYAADTVLSEVRVTHQDGRPGLAAIFDTTFSGGHNSTLLGPPWSGGNLPVGTVFGNALAVLGHLGCGDDDCDDHDEHGDRDDEDHEGDRGDHDDEDRGDREHDDDDEGSPESGVIELVFSTPVFAFGLDLLGVDHDALENGAIVFHDGTTSATVALTELLAGGAFDRDAIFEENSANRIAPFSASELGLAGFDRVEVRLGGPGAIDNLVLDGTAAAAQVPEPSAAALLGLGLAGLFAARRLR